MTLFCWWMWGAVGHWRSLPHSRVPAGGKSPAVQGLVEGVRGGCCLLLPSFGAALSSPHLGVPERVGSREWGWQQMKRVVPVLSLLWGGRPWEAPQAPLPQCVGAVGAPQRLGLRWELPAWAPTRSHPAAFRQVQAARCPRACPLKQAQAGGGELPDLGGGAQHPHHNGCSREAGTKLAPLSPWAPYTALLRAPIYRGWLYSWGSAPH